MLNRFKCALMYALIAGGAAFSSLFAACANPVGMDDDSEDVPVVGSVQQELAGTGDSFWQPLRHEMVTNVYYCWSAASVSTQIKNLVQNAQQVSWERYVNVDMIDEGVCSSAPHAAEAIHIDGYVAGAFTEHAGTRVRGAKMGLPYLTQAGYQFCPGFSFEDCLTMASAHEFGHALGFGHESAREDFPGSCPNGNPAPHQDAPDEINTLITLYDASSLLDRSYCGTRIPLWLSPSDIAGAVALYGSSSATCSSPGRACRYVSYSRPSPSGGAQYALRYQRAQPAPGTANAWYVQPTEAGAVNVQTFVGEWERVELRPAGSYPSDGYIHYGDSVGLLDRWGRWLSARDTGDVDTRSNRDAWELWTVETTDGALYPGGSRLLVNGPFRLLSAHGNRLTVSSSGDVKLTTATSTSEWRINGPLMHL
jgi:hypothetical protein